MRFFAMQSNKSMRSLLVETLARFLGETSDKSLSETAATVLLLIIYSKMQYHSSL